MKDADTPQGKTDQAEEVESEDANLTESELAELEADVSPGEGIEVEQSTDSGIEDEALGPNPPDRRLITAPYDLAVLDLVSQVKDKRLELSPVYQRRYVWDNRKASKLVESLLINVPIPVCYLAEESDGRRSVIDGQQRLRSLVRYLNNEFSLRGLEVLPELNRKRFNQLTDRQQRLISHRTIRCIVISEDSDPDIRFDVFERLNTGSVPLNAQELRNSVYRGPLNELLRGLADAPEWKACIGGKSNQRMMLEELSLRFLALDDKLTDYRPSLKRFLNEYMRQNRQVDAEAGAVLSEKVLETLRKTYAVFGEHAFRRITGEGENQTWSHVVNSALFDVVMLNFARIEIPAEELGQSADEIEGALVEAMQFDTDFDDAISLATGDRVRLRTRIRIFAEKLNELGFDSGLQDELADS